MRTSLEKYSSLGFPMGGIICFLLLWQLAAFAAGSRSILPGPLETVVGSAALLADGYWLDFAATALRTVASWMLAMLVGVPFGLLLGVSARAYRASSSVIAFLRSLPAFMLVTIPVALGHGGEVARIATIAFACALIVIDECAESLLTASRDRLDLLKAYRAPFFFVITRILPFEALGRIIVPAARTLIGISFVIAIVCESLVLPTHGVGARLLTALSALEMDRVYGFLALTGIMGLLLNVAIHRTAKRLVFWGS